MKEADQLAYGNLIDSYVNYQKQEAGNEHKIKCSRDKDWVARLSNLATEINTASELSRLEELSIRTELEDKRDPFLEHGEPTVKVVPQTQPTEPKPKENPVLDKPEAMHAKRAAGEK
ncbi:MAG: hypothetical protein KDD62_11395 [Bdellovibrionales bacterium]|nr:hypothetical protein [Bdellovibrionales bacterium]